MNANGTTPRKGQIVIFLGLTLLSFPQKKPCHFASSAKNQSKCPANQMSGCRGKLEIMKKTLFALWACLQVSLLRGEDLTTLDGHTFTNITEIDKYSKMVVFTYNGVRKAITFTNLPVEFCTKHRIVIKTNVPVTSATVTTTQQQQLSPIDLLLFNNRDKRLLECDSTNINENDESKSWQICLQGVQVSLVRYIDTYPDMEKKEPTEQIEFAIGQEAMINNVFDKYIEWDSIAQTNKSEDFEKVITDYKDLSFYANYPDLAALLNENNSFEFDWKKEFSQSLLYDSGHSGVFYKEDIIHFKDLLKELPTLKQKLANDIRNKEAQKDLFK